MATLLPPILWAQRKDAIFITINLSDVDPKEAKVELTEGKLVFSASITTATKEKKSYACELEFFAEVDQADKVRAFSGPRRVGELCGLLRRRALLDLCFDRPGRVLLVAGGKVGAGIRLAGKLAPLLHLPISRLSPAPPALAGVQVRHPPPLDPLSPRQEGGRLLGPPPQGQVQGACGCAGAL